MPDMEKLHQIQMVAHVISTLPPQQPGQPRIPLAKPKIAQWATELVEDYGVRVHPELARKQLVDETPGKTGVFNAQRVEDVVDMPGMLALLRGIGAGVPSLMKLADDIEAALGDPDKEAELLDRIRREHPDVIATARQRAEQTPPEAYEQ